MCVRVNIRRVAALWLGYVGGALRLLIAAATHVISSEARLLANAPQSIVVVLVIIGGAGKRVGGANLVGLICSPPSSILWTFTESTPNVEVPSPIYQIQVVIIKLSNIGYIAHCPIARHLSA